MGRRSTILTPKDEYVLTFRLKTEKVIEDTLHLGRMKHDRVLKELKRYQKEYPLYDIKLFKTVYEEVKIEK